MPSTFNLRLTLLLDTFKRPIIAVFAFWRSERRWVFLISYQSQSRKATDAQLQGNNNVGDLSSVAIDNVEFDSEQTLTLKDKINPVDEIRNLINAGQYDTARQRLGLALGTAPDNTMLSDLLSQLMEELEVDFQFNYLPGPKRKEMTRKPSSEIGLTENDPYFFLVSSSGKCFLYMFQLQSSGNLTILFPNSGYVSERNPFPGGTLRMPKDYQWFYLEASEGGTETIYVIASRWRNEALEDLIKRYQETTVLDENLQIKDQIIKRLELEEQETDALPGLVVGKHQFTHIASAARRKN